MSTITYTVRANNQQLGQSTKVTGLTNREAHRVADAILLLSPGVEVTVTPEYPPLAGFNFNAAEAYAASVLAQYNRVAAIKFVRMLTGQGLKEAKDWIDLCFPRPAQ